MLKSDVIIFLAQFFALFVFVRAGGLKLLVWAWRRFMVYRLRAQYALAYRCYERAFDFEGTVSEVYRVAGNFFSPMVEDGFPHDLLEVVRWDEKIRALFEVKEGPDVS